MTRFLRFKTNERLIPVEGEETILEATLRAGLSPNYGCNNGNCGLCLAHLLSGSVRRVRTSDYRLKAAEKEQGLFLMCTHTPDSDIEIQTAFAHGAEDVPIQGIRARVKEITYLDSELAIVHLHTPRNRTLRFLAGQYIELSCAPKASAYFYIASCPCDDRHLQLHIPTTFEIHGNRVMDCLSTRQHVDIRGPMGDFSLCENPARPGLFVALDHGFAPIKSLIEHAIALEYPFLLSLLRVHTTGALPYLHNLCRSWSDALDYFEYAPIALETTPTELPFALTVALELALGTLDQPVIYLAGPQAYVDLVQPQIQRLAPEAEIRVARLITS